MQDTIFAPATAAGVAGVSVIRVSGPKAWSACAAFGVSVPHPRYMAMRALRVDSQIIDRALVVVFEKSGSFTGEDVVEFHLHGSPAIQHVVLNHLSELPDFRSAQAGEFTQRALHNGRLSLTEVEGLSDVLRAETALQLRQAMRVFSGELQAKAEGWRARLLRCMAEVTVALDFADEEVPQSVSEALEAEMRALAGELSAEAHGTAMAERIRSGFEVAIVGAPNVGKSTLLNYIAGREAAITSEIAGTTRDIIEVRYDLDGIPVTFLDTAGLRDSADPVESIGISRAVERAEGADIRVFLGEAPQDVPFEDGDIRLAPKADLGCASGISGKTGQGVPELLSDLRVELSKRAAGSTLSIRQRHKEGLLAASGALDEGVETLRILGQEELVSEHLTMASRHLDMVSGRIGVEDVLGEIFSTFCIGK